VVHTYSEELEWQNGQWFIPTAKRWGGKVHSGSYLQRRGGAAKVHSGSYLQRRGGAAKWTVVHTYSEEVGRQSAQWFIPTAKRWGGKSAQRFIPTAKRWGGRVHSGSYLQRRGGVAEFP
jgi:hypothetical protein